MRQKKKVKKVTTRYFTIIQGGRQEKNENYVNKQIKI